VTVTVAEPKGAVLDAVRVRTLLGPVVEAWLKLAVTPLGNPLALKVTPPVKPPVRVIEIVLVPFASRLIARLAGLAASVNPGDGTVRLIVVVRVRLPLTPVTVTVAEPKVAVPEAVRVNVLLVPVVEVWLKLAVTPPGNPLTLKATLLVKLARWIVIVLAPFAPRFTVRLPGLAESAKSGVVGAVTVRANVVERVSPPPEPLMVTLVVPVATVLDAARVNVLPPPAVEAGLNVAVTPLGNPLALKATLSAKPLVRVMVIALFAVKPRVKFVGVAESAKSGLEILFAVVNVRSPDVDRLPASSFDFTL
jgi:hypothetical protein